MIKEIVEEVLKVEEGKKLDVKTFKKLLDKYGYSEDPEEISFALENDELATVADLEEMVDILNKQGYDVKTVEEKLKDALN